MHDFHVRLPVDGSLFDGFLKRETSTGTAAGRFGHTRTRPREPDTSKNYKTFTIIPKCEMSKAFLVAGRLMHKGLDPRQHVGPFLPVIDGMEDGQALVFGQAVLKNGNGDVSQHAV